MIYSPTGSSDVFDPRLHDLSSQISHLSFLSTPLPPPPPPPSDVFEINESFRGLACVASVSVWFRSKERPRNGILGFGRARNETRAKKWRLGRGGEGKEGNAYRQTPWFWKPAFTGERSAWLARLVEQCWHVSIKGLFHTERTVWYVSRILILSGCCLFWSARFVLQCKNIFFDLFWNVRLFLRLNKGSFNLI